MGDTVKLILDTDIDVTVYTSVSVRYRKPDGTSGLWTGVVDSENDDRILYYTTVDDLDVEGKWAVQAQVESPNIILRGKIVNFMVYDTIPDAA